MGVPEFLISPEYLSLQREMHKDAAYGTSSGRVADAVEILIADKKHASVLDYGCGKGHFKTEMRRRGLDDLVREYDPAIEGKDGEPDHADLVICTDVLEHIERDKLPAVI